MKRTLGTLMVCSAMAGAAAATDNTVVYTWPGYLPDDMAARYTRETGSKVQMSSMDSVETFQSKILTGKSGFDVVTPTLSMVGPQIKAGAFKAIDISRLSNFKNIDPDMLKKLNEVDPQHRYVVPYVYGTDGLGINFAKVKAALGSTPLPDNLWDLIFKPDYMKKLSKCGVSLLDSSPDVIGTTLFYLGKDPFSENEANLKQAAAVLKSVRPYIRTFSASAGYLESLPSGDFCVVFGYSGDIATAALRAREAKTGQDISYVIPKSGAIIWADLLAIPKDAPHPERALAMLDFMLRPEVAAAASNGASYPVANVPSRSMLKGDIWKDTNVLPDSKLMQKLVPVKTLSAKTQRLWNQAFNQLKFNK
ncbi:extracellular solute-binding protein [Leeia oryzae]|uniref:extracellular solute-binding protein n=1 Tax=Leeia oryzae TaxID=356662 RepID=UPI00039E1BBB|nr:extracellular solute-binding protein [Leeia oryzae]